jgi:hypothetical protein
VELQPYATYLDRATRVERGVPIAPGANIGANIGAARMLAALLLPLLCGAASAAKPNIIYFLVE